MSTLFSTSSGGAAEPASGSLKGEWVAYVGTYTGQKSQGIYAFRFDPETGKLGPVGLVAETPNPSFLAIHPNKRFLYAVSEIGEFGGKRTGAVSAFAIDPGSAGLRLINQSPSEGGGPCHLIVDKTGRWVLVANYGGGSIAVLPIRDDGSLGPAASAIQHQGSSVNPQRQKEPHAHSIHLDAANRFAFAADLGLDKILVYRFDVESGRLAANDPPFAAVKPGAGPRHFAFHPGGKFAYVINELDCTITAFEYDAAAGSLREVQTISTLPEGEAVRRGYSTAEIQVHPSGRFLYGSNRGHDTVAAFSVDEKSGRLKLVEHESTQGRIPRNFAVDPTGRYLLAENQDSDSIVVFRIDAESGALEPTGEKVEVGSPVCIKFVQF